jgi:hypothetical protein
MFRLIYSATAAGAPNQYGDATDTLRAENGVVLQSFPKARVGAATPSAQLASTIDAWLDGRDRPGDPVILMVHGYLFDPSAKDAAPGSPFDSVYGLPPEVDHRMSWLPLARECDNDGKRLADDTIAFAYKSQAGFFEYGNACWSNSYQYAVFDLAPLAARALATILGYLGTKPHLKIRVLAHSLGTRTFTQAIGLLAGKIPANLERAVLLDGAEFCVDAAHNFAGCRFDVFNIASGTDEVLRLGAEKFCHPMRMTGSLNSCVIGRDGLGGNDRWLDLRLDKLELDRWLRDGSAPGGQSYDIGSIAEDNSHPFANLGHWSCYTNVGNRALVADLLMEPAMSVAGFKAAGVPSGTGTINYGRFNGVTVPPTPQTNTDRLRLMTSPATNAVG